MNAAVEMFCPACNLKNDVSARVCVHCKKPLSFSSGPHTTRQISENAQQIAVEELLKNAPVPEDCIVIFSQESAQSIATVSDEKFILGRAAEGVREPIVDLSAFGAYGLGVSRLHVFVQKTESGYEIRDMNSTNGTYLNDESLVPNQVYPLRSGDRIRMGKMCIIVLFGKQE
jgi:hypothetical protein